MADLNSFIAYLQNEKRYSIHSVNAYRQDLLQFYTFLGSSYSLSSWVEVKPAYIKSWVYSLLTSKVKERSVNRKLAALNTFYRYLIRLGEMQTNPMLGISGLKTAKHLHHWVEEKQMQKLLEKPADIGNEPKFSELRDNLIIELFYGTGIRLSELIHLKKKDVFLQERMLKVIGKRNKERLIPINSGLEKSLQSYINQYLKDNIPACENLIVTDTGKPVYPMFVYRVVKRKLGHVEVSLPKQNPHLLRHTFATHMLNNGADLNAVKELLGHSSLAATQVYTHTTINKLLEIYKQAHPKSTKT